MPADVAIGTAVATALVKAVLDEVYKFSKEAAKNRLAKSRSDLKESAVARAVNSVTKVKTLWNVEKETSLYDFYYPSSIEFQARNVKRISSLSELGITQNFVIQGTAGQGKSIFLRYLCGQELNSQHSSKRVPIFVELRRIKSGASLTSLILEVLEKFKLPREEEVWRFLAATGKFVLMLDAFDEIDPALSDAAVAELEHITDLYGDKLQIIVTARPESDIQRSARFRVVKLAQLSNNDHLPFLKKVCSDGSQASSLHKVLVSSSTDIRELLTTPLMLTLLVILYKAAQTIPDTLPRFYEELFDVLFYRHDQSKPGFRRKRFTDLDDSKVKKIFSALCFFVRLEGPGTLTAEQLRSLVAKAAAACNESVDPDRFISELTKTVCLMMQDGLEYSFIHKSVVQYYAASFVRTSSEEFGKRFYDLVLKRRRSWDLELKFLSEIDNYRHAKYYEIPLLNRVAHEIGYSFDSPDEAQPRRRLNDFAMKRISLVRRRPVTEASSKALRSGDEGEFVAWSHRVEDDVLLEVLGRPWGAELLKAAQDPAVRTKLLAHSDRSNFDARGEVRTPAVSYADLIDNELQGLADIVLTEMQNRFDYLRSVVRTEESKTDMLAQLK